VLNGTGLKLSGFACIVGGKVLNGSHPTRRTHLADSYAHADGSPNGLHASLHGFGTLGYVSLDESDRAFVRDGTQARRWRR
jgi:hypothetical protein